MPFWHIQFFANCDERQLENSCSVTALIIIIQCYPRKYKVFSLGNIDTSSLLERCLSPPHKLAVTVSDRGVKLYVTVPTRNTVSTRRKATSKPDSENNLM